MSHLALDGLLGFSGCETSRAGIFSFGHRLPVMERVSMAVGTGGKLQLGKGWVQSSPSPEKSQPCPGSYLLRGKVTTCLRGLGIKFPFSKATCGKVYEFTNDSLVCSFL